MKSASSTKKVSKINTKALKIAREFVADPDARAQVKVRLAMQHGMQVSDMIDEAVVMARELLRLNGEKA